MLKLTPYFKVYNTYCKNYETANKLYSHLKKNNKKFAKFLKKYEHRKALLNMNLESFLVIPI